MLKSKEIDGLMLDRFTVANFYQHVDHHPQAKLVSYFIKTSTMHSEMLYKGEKLSYGILVKRKEDYEYFVDFVRDNQQVINACNRLFLNRQSEYEKIQDDEELILFQADGSLFWPPFIMGTVCISCIVCFGVAYEWRRKKVKHFDRETIL